jgi:fructokinase
VFAVIIGTGCGAGVALNGRAHIGGNGNAGEWGHNPLPWMNDDELRYRAEVPCYCGKQGVSKPLSPAPALPPTISG